MDTLQKVILGGTCYDLTNQEIFQTKAVEKNEKMCNSLFLCLGVIKKIKPMRLLYLVSRDSWD